MCSGNRAFRILNLVLCTIVATCVSIAAADDPFAEKATHTEVDSIGLDKDLTFGNLSTVTMNSEGN